MAETTSPSVQEAKPARGGIRKFLLGHDRLVTFAGAFIVFASFVAREEVRDNLKDLVASVDSARAVFATRRDVTLIADQISTVGEVALNIDEATLKGSTFSEKRNAAFHAADLRIWYNSDYVGLLGASLDNISNLLGKLFPDDGEDKRLIALKARVVDFQNRCGKAASDHSVGSDVAERDLTADVLRTIIENDFLRRVLPLVRDVTPLASDARQLGDEVLKRAEETEKQRQARYDQVNVLCISLFVLGWGLGLVSQLWGRKAESLETSR